MRRILLAAGLSSALLASGSCLAGQPDPGTRIVNAEVDLPALKPGLWEYRRSMGPEGAPPKEDVARHCTDPSADMRAKRAELALRSCQFEPMFLKQNRYLSSWVCMTQKGTIRFQDALTVTDNAHYVDKVESRSNGATTRQTITAERLSDCTLPAPKANGKAARPDPAPVGANSTGR